MLFALIVLIAFIAAVSSSETIKATIFADNYFEFYVNGVLVQTDPLDFTPHQAVEFTFGVDKSVPITYAILAKDYATSSGYEYTNSTHPGIGDGSLIMMFSDGIVSDASWKCFTTSFGPTDESIKAGCSAKNLTPCELSYTDEPEGWKLYDFDDSKWSKATLFTSDETGWGRTPTYTASNSHCTTVTDPYTGANADPSYAVLLSTQCENPQAINWGSASFIWQADLDRDNTILCRKNVN